MAISIPSTHSVGDTGHTTDHNTIVADLTTLFTASTDWINVTAPAYGATGNGSTDDTAAIQAAITAASATGSVVYIPAGNYRTTAPLTYSSTTIPLKIVGDGTAGRQGHKNGVSVIRPNFVGHAFAFTNCTYVDIEDLDIFADGTNSGGPTADYAAVYCSSVNTFYARRMQIAKGSGNFSFNTCFRVISSFTSFIEQCYITGEEEAVWFDGGSVMTVRDTTTTTTAGNGFGAIRMDNTSASSTKPATLFVENCYTQVGDWGLWAGGGTTNDWPTFIYVQNFQVNNPAVGGMYFGSGSRVFADQYWVSGANSPAGAVHGVNFDTNYKGTVYFSNSQFIKCAGHGAWLQGGQGFNFHGCSFGGNGSNASNTYDDLHVATGVSDVLIDACQFDIDHAAGVTSPPARSALYVESGATDVQLLNSHSPGYTVYGTSSVVDLTDALVRRGNIGLGLPDDNTGSGSTVTSTGFNNLGASFTIPPYDMTAGVTYVYRAWGHGTEASSAATNLNVRATLGGNTLGFFTPVTTPAAGAAFIWEYELRIRVTLDGTSGTINLRDKFSWNTGGSAIEVATAHAATGTTANTQQANALVLQADWVSNVNSPTITCDGTTLERFQPIPAA